MRASARVVCMLFVSAARNLFVVERRTTRSRKILKIGERGSVEKARAHTNSTYHRERRTRTTEQQAARDTRARGEEQYGKAKRTTATTRALIPWATLRQMQPHAHGEPNKLTYRIRDNFFLAAIDSDDFCGDRRTL